ncbi:MAG: nuclear transport factor 2 family protein [Bacteroidota bacterium]
MLKIISVAILTLFLSVTLYAQSSNDIKQNAKKEILQVLSFQEKAWNKGNLDEYMQGYWKSDSLKFIGSKGIQYGWQATLDNYKKSYPDKATMGILTFSNLNVELLSENSAFIVGQWHLKREKGDVGGYFTLLFKKKNNNWVIICDHSS